MLLLKSVEESFLDSAQAILVLLGWWLHDSNLCFHCRIEFSWHVSVFTWSSSYKDTIHTELEAYSVTAWPHLAISK